MNESKTRERQASRAGPAPVSDRRCHAALLSLAVVAGVPASAQSASATPVELWLSDAPLVRVLEHVAGNDGVRVIVDDSIDGVVDGRLDGEREGVLARLVVEHDLAVHGNGDTIWFDRADRPVVEFVELPPDEASNALSLLDAVDADIAAPDAVVERSDEGLMLSGPRAFVESALDRLAALPQEPTTPAGPAQAALFSVSDIPGFDVDYTQENGR